MVEKVRPVLILSVPFADTDRSVVTEADASKVFEFVTESTRSPKRGPAADMTTVNRFEIVADGTGSRVTRRCRIVRLSKMPAIMRLAPLRAMALAEGRKQLRSSLQNLVRVIEHGAANGSS